MANRENFRKANKNNSSTLRKNCTNYKIAGQHQLHNQLISKKHKKTNRHILTCKFVKMTKSPK